MFWTKFKYYLILDQNCKRPKLHIAQNCQNVKEKEEERSSFRFLSEKIFSFHNNRGF